LGLSVKFPRIVICESKDSLGLGIIKPRTMVVIYIMKMYLGNKRYGSEVAKLAETLEE